MTSTTEPSAASLRDLRRDFVSKPVLKSEEGPTLLPCEYPLHSLLSDEDPIKVPQQGANEFNPAGLNQTYEDEGLKLRLPKFAVINVRRTSQKIHIQKNFLETEFSMTEGGSFEDLDNHNMPHCEFLPTHAAKRIQRFREVTFRLLQCLALGTIVCTGIFRIVEAWHPALPTVTQTLLGYNFSPEASQAIEIASQAILCAASFGILWILFSIARSASIARHLRETVDYSLPGFLPDRIRNFIVENQKAYDDIYLVCDAQNQWQSEGTKFLTATEARELDPLILGEKKGKFYLLGWFDLTPAEAYLTNEF